MVRRFLDSQATHLLFVDGDVVLSRDLLAGMLAASVKGHDCVMAPYPRAGTGEARKALHWEVLASVDAANRAPQARVFRYSIHLDETGKLSPDEWACAPISAMGLGCALISRACLQKMTANAYRRGQAFDDRPHGASDTADLFGFLPGKPDETGDYRGFSPLLSEDFSFCKRWRDMGGKVQLYVGPGAPAVHVKTTKLEGRIEALGFSHTEVQDDTAG